MSKKVQDTMVAILMCLGCVLTLAMFIFAVSCFVEGAEALSVEKSSSELVEPAETQTQGAPMFDTNALNDWCSGGDEGTIRMVEGYPIKHTPSGWHIEDGFGNVWKVSGITLSEYDFLLLWIADSGTPDKVEDDVIIKVWREAY